MSADAIDESRIIVGNPDQSTTVGAVSYGAVGTTAPTSATATLTGMTSVGYIDAAGVTLTIDQESKTLQEWGGEIVKRLKKAKTAVLKFACMELANKGAAELAGATVTETAASSAHGLQEKIEIFASGGAEHCFAVRVKDGTAKTLLWVPRGDATVSGDMSFTSEDAAKWNFEVQCLKKGSEALVTVLTDDGEVTA